MQCWVEDGSKNEDDPYPLSDEEDEEEAIDDTTLTWGRESHQLSYFHYSNALNDEKDLSSVIPSNEDHINEIADSAFDYVSDSGSDESYESYDSTESTTDDSTSVDSTSTTCSSLNDSNVDNRYADLIESQSASQTDSKTNESVSAEQKKSTSSSTPKIRKLYIQMEYYKNGTLDDMIQRGDVRVLYLNNE